MQRTYLLSLCCLLLAPVAASEPTITQMRALRMHDYGTSDVLRVERTPVPTPQRGQVRIRVHAASVNPIDWKIRSGRLRRTSPVAFPYIPGRDVAGTIDALGSSVTQWKVGDSVFAVLEGGGMAEYVIADARDVAPKPSKLTFEEAAGIPTVSLTAWRTLIQTADIKQGQRILIHGGAGGVGSIAVQLAAWRGAHVIATASERNHEYLQSIGANEVIDYRTTRFEDVVKSVDVVLDTVGGDTLTRSTIVLREGGTLLTIVGRPSAQTCDERKIRCPDWNANAPVHAGNQLARLGQLFDSGTLKMTLQAVFPLEESDKALELSEGGHARGKIIVRVAN